MMHAVYCKFTLYFDSVMTFILKFGGNLSGKCRWWLGTATTSFDLEWSSRL